jgi:hypothetical protein
MHMAGPLWMSNRVEVLEGASGDCRFNLAHGLWLYGAIDNSLVAANLLSILLGF